MPCTSPLCRSGPTFTSRGGFRPVRAAPRSRASSTRTIRFSISPRACKFLRPGGYLIVGLYNRIGRLPTTLRRLYFSLTKTDPRKVDYVMREMAQSDQKLRAWYLDQYAHPQETRHSVDQVLRWFAEEHIDYTAAAPPIRLAEPFDLARPLFAPSPPGSRFEHWLVQLWWIITISHEGALFDLIGRKQGGT